MRRPVARRAALAGLLACALPRAWAASTTPQPAAMAATVPTVPTVPESLPESMPVPVSLQLPLIFKILTYDRNLAGRAGGELRVAVVLSATDGGTVRAEIAEGFRALADHTVKGMRLRLVTIEYASEAQMDGALRASQSTVLYVAPGNAAHVDALARLARTQRIVTTTGVPGYVAQGIAVGIGAQQDRPQILINLAASRAGGSEFDASLLRIVRIVR